MNIHELFEYNRETVFLDYKEKIDFINNKVDFIRDIIAFSNADEDCEKYIIYGVKEVEDGYNFVGLNNLNFGDPADYQKLISEKIEPQIKLDFITETYLDNKYLILIIKADKE